MALKELGDVEVDIGDKTYTLSPTWEGLMKVEELTGHTLAQLAQKIIGMQCGVRDITGILYGCLYGAEDGKPGISYRDFGMEVISHGMASFTPICRILITAGYTGMPIKQIETDVDKIVEDVKKKEKAQKK